MFRGSYAFFIIGLMVLGVVAGAFYFYRPTNPLVNPCGGSTNAKYSSHYQKNINNENFDAVNVTFTSVNQQDEVLGVTFLTTTFSDPSQLHQEGGACVSNTSAPATITLSVSFGPNVPTEKLTIPSYKDGIFSDQGPFFTTHTGPKAGLMWYHQNPYVILLVSIG